MPLYPSYRGALKCTTFNAHLGKDEDTWKGEMEKNGLPDFNLNVELLSDFRAILTQWSPEIDEGHQLTKRLQRGEASFQGGIERILERFIWLPQRCFGKHFDPLGWGGRTLLMVCSAWVMKCLR